MPYFRPSVVEQSVSCLKVLSLDSRLLLTCSYYRECQRRNNGLARMVPRLREIHVLRDAWTKLNVHPAKIMQVYFYSLMYVCMYGHVLVPSLSYTVHGLLLE